MTPFSGKECSWMHNTSCASTLTSTPQLLTLLHKRDATVPPAWQWEFSLGHHTGKWCLCASNLQERVQFERNMLRSGLYFCQHNEKFLIVDPERQCLLDLFHLLSCNNYSRHLLLANLIMRVLFRLSHLVKVRKIKCSLFDIEKVTQVVTSLSTVNQNHDFVITITPTKVVVLPKNNPSRTQDVNPCTLSSIIYIDDTDEVATLVEAHIDPWVDTGKKCTFGQRNHSNKARTLIGQAEWDVVNSLEKATGELCSLCSEA